MIIFIIVTYKQNQTKYQKLLNSLSGYKVIQINNNKKNLGYAAGVNLGIKKALQTKTEWIIVLNQDLTLNANSIKQLNNLLINHPPAIIGPFSGKLDNHRWTTIYPFRNKVDYLSGSFMAIHKDVIKKTGLFYEPYFMYYEDVDYCFRAQKKGFPLVKMKIFGIAHQDGSTLGQNSFLYEYYLARNHQLFVLRNAPLKVKLYEFLRFPKTLIEHLWNKNYGALSGLRDFILKKFGSF